MINRIKIVRETLKLSQREFGERIGVSRDVISNIENGRVEPKDLFIHHLCQFYKINETWLRTGKGQMFEAQAPIKNSNLDNALKIFESLRPEFQEYALEQMKKLAELQDKT